MSLTHPILGNWEAFVIQYLVSNISYTDVNSKSISRMTFVGYDCQSLDISEQQKASLASFVETDAFRAFLEKNGAIYVRLSDEVGIRYLSTQPSASVRCLFYDVAKFEESVTAKCENEIVQKRKSSFSVINEVVIFVLLWGFIYNIVKVISSR